MFKLFLFLQHPSERKYFQKYVDCRILSSSIRAPIHFRCLKFFLLHINQYNNTEMTFKTIIYTHLCWKMDFSNEEIYANQLCIPPFSLGKNFKEIYWFNFCLEAHFLLQNFSTTMRVDINSTVKKKKIEIVYSLNITFLRINDGLKKSINIYLRIFLIIR